MSEKYNGWTNYETWAVKLWMDNDGSGEYWTELAADAGAGVWGMSKQLKEHYEDAVPVELDAVGWAADLLGAALSAVNWEEIAGHIIDDAVQEPAPV